MRSSSKTRAFNSSVGLLHILGICMFTVLFFLSSCTPTFVDPMTLPIQEVDLEETEHPPTSEELAITPHLLLPLIVYKDTTATQQRLTPIIEFIETSFQQHGNFSMIPLKKVDDLLASEENKLFQPTNVADAIQLGKSLEADFVAQYQIFITETKTVENIDLFKATINMTIFTTNSGQVVLKKDIHYDSNKIETSQKELKKIVQENFPLRGYILETRGGKQYARISLGRTLGIQKNRRFQVRERIVTKEIVLGVARKAISFAPQALTTGSVIQILEDEAWIEIDKKDRSKIKKGQVVFSMIEKDNIYQ